MMSESKKKKIIIILVLKDEESTHALRCNWKRQYGIIQVGPVEHLYLQKINELVCKQAGTINLEKIVRVVVEEELFGELKETHRSLMHGRVVKMAKAMESKYANISRNVIKQFLKLCPRCIEGAPRISSRAGIKPILTKGFNRRGQVDLIDFQSHPDEGMSWLLVYQDHGVKFAHFVPLPDKKAQTVAKALLKIFPIQGV